MSCEYLKRDATLCGAMGFNGGRLCYYHRMAIPYKLCSGGCGRVVSTKHGRPRCCKCDPKEAQQQLRAVRKEKRPEPTPEPVPEPMPKNHLAELGKILSDAMFDYVLSEIATRHQ